MKKPQQHHWLYLASVVFALVGLMPGLDIVSNAGGLYVPETLYLEHLKANERLVAHDFSFWNLSTHDIWLKAEPYCGCTTLSKQSTVIHPLSEFVVTMSVDRKSLEGHSSRVTFDLKGARHPSISIEVAED